MDLFYIRGVEIRLLPASVPVSAIFRTKSDRAGWGNRRIPALLGSMSGYAGGIQMA